ncbi:MAG TPA: NAD-dependent epimerase/dehydratase family protein [Thermomonospora sp.]|nr:NAD-dependent epimerase/dehydratase family protein [Thermomonospora sp.]
MTPPGGFAGERVLVTGSGGFIGTALLALLREARPAALLAPRRAECDLMDEDAVESVFAAFRPTIVVHLAGWVAGVQGKIESGGRAFYETVRMGLTVIEAARRSGARKVVVAGSAGAYPDGAAPPLREDDLWSGRPHWSEGPYAQAKRALLAQLEAYQGQYGLDHAYLICTNVYGPGDRFDERATFVLPSLVRRFTEAARSGARRVVVWGDGSPTRDFLYVDDAARGFAVAALHGSGAMNLATGRSVTIRDLAGIVAEATGYTGEIAWDTTKPNGRLAQGFDVARITALGWRPGVPLREGVRRTCAWYARQGR